MSFTSTAVCVSAVCLLLTSFAAVVKGQLAAPGESVFFKKGVGGGGLCGDLDDGPGGLHTVTWWYE
jgi:hypothetical protein